MKANFNPLTREQQRRLERKLKHEEEIKERFMTLRQHAFTCIALNRRRQYGRRRLYVLGEDIAQVATELLTDWGDINNDILVKELRRIKMHELAAELETIVDEMRKNGRYSDSV